MTVVVPARMPEPSKTISPVKLSHFLVRTTRFELLKDWYMTVLGAAVVFESDKICLLTLFGSRREHDAENAAFCVGGTETKREVSP